MDHHLPGCFRKSWIGFDSLTQMDNKLKHPLICSYKYFNINKDTGWVKSVSNTSGMISQE